jgi:hypothetical protein
MIFPRARRGRNCRRAIVVPPSTMVVLADLDPVDGIFGLGTF